MYNREIIREIDNLLLSTHRPGIETVIAHLHQGNDAFYRVPASTKFHDNFSGGLAKHSMDVYLEAKVAYEKLVTSGIQPSFGMDSVILCSLLHDVCKLDEYEIVDGKSKHTTQYRPGGAHGLKSERLLRGWHLDLTADERRAIIWHMGAYANDAREHFSTTYRPVASASLLVKIIHETDHHAAKKSK